MIKLYDTGVYLVNGTDLVQDAKELLYKTGKQWNPARDTQETMAYSIL